MMSSQVGHFDFRLCAWSIINVSCNLCNGGNCFATAVAVMLSSGAFSETSLFCNAEDRTASDTR